MNAERSKRGISSLLVAADLMAIARAHSADMAKHGAIYHDENLPNEVHSWREIGENVGRGPSASAVHNGFMASSVHRVHILKPTYKQLGVGAVWGTSGGYKYLYVTQVFVDRGVAPHVSRSAPSHVAPVVKKPVAKPPPPPPAPVPPSLSIVMLVQLQQMDAGFVARKGMFPERLPP